MAAASPSTKPLRADARRNYDAIVVAGKKVLARAGADAPMEAVAKEAGVGQGTLYRHFPTREHLFVAVMQGRVDRLDLLAQKLCDHSDAGAAVELWIREYDQSSRRYRGLAALVAEGLTDEASPVAAACAPMKARFADLLVRAQQTGAVRPDVTPVQLLAIVSSLPKDHRTGLTDELHLDIVLRGMRAQPPV